MDFSYASTSSHLTRACHRDRQYEPQRLARKSKSFASGLRDFVGNSIDTLLAGNGGAKDKSEQRAQNTKLEYEKNICKGRLLRATTYGEYRNASVELDELEKADAWKNEVESELYDFNLIESRIREFEDVRSSGDVDRMLRVLSRSLTRHLGGMTNAILYEHSKIGTKTLIDRYINTVRNVFDTLVRSMAEDNDPTRNEELLEGMRFIRRQYGRTALLLSGGGTLGMNHIGVIKALLDAGSLPRVVSGTSAGSIVAAVLCSRPENEIEGVLQEFCHGDLDVFVSSADKPGAAARLRYLMENGHIYDVSNLKRVMTYWLGDLTFSEAYQKTNRVLNIVVSTTDGSHGPYMLNAYSTPDVLIRSAVVASCSVPYVFKAGALECKHPITGEIGPHNGEEKYVDGSLQADIPSGAVAEKLSCNSFIVSQVNPHVRLFLREAQSNPGFGGRVIEACTELAWSEFLHRMDMCAELGLLPKSLDMLHGVAGQPYTGDITILPDIDLKHIARVLYNPTERFMEHAKINGERATWKKMNQINYHLAVENIIEEAVVLAEKTAALAAQRNELHTQALTAYWSDLWGCRSQPGIEARIDDDHRPRWLRRQHFKSASQPSTPTATDEKFFDSPPASRTRSPARAPLNLTMTQRLKSPTPLSAHSRTYSEIPMTTSKSFEFCAPISPQSIQYRLSPSPALGTLRLPTSLRSAARGRGRGRRRSRSRSRSRTPAVC